MKKVENLEKQWEVYDNNINNNRDRHINLENVNVKVVKLCRSRCHDTDPSVMFLQSVSAFNKIFILLPPQMFLFSL